MISRLFPILLLCAPAFGFESFKDAMKVGKEYRKNGEYKKARVAFEAAARLGRTVYDRVYGQLDIGNTWLAEDKFEEARVAYTEAFKFPKASETQVRALIIIEIANSYMQEKRFAESAEHYRNALVLGPGGLRLTFARKELEKAERFAKENPSKQARADTTPSRAVGVPSPETPGPDSKPSLAPDRVVNVQSFKRLVKGGDWSSAIQAAIDFISKENGYEAGGTVLFPAGSYRIDRSIVVGGNPAHWGIRLLGYGATLIGGKQLDQQPLVEPEPEEKDKGVPMLVLKNPKGQEGASYTIEGLRFKREQKANGVGISVPWKEIPKNVTFRGLKIHDQKVGVHIKYAWQFSFQDCLFRGNEVGMLLQSHGNNVGIVNCVFRRQHLHGLIIGPDRGQWGSNGYHISGSIFESNKGYGIHLLSAAQVKISGNYFEGNGNGIGVFTPYGEVTIDTNFFWGSYGHSWMRNPYSDDGHVVLAGTKKVQLRNNNYAGVTALFRRKERMNRWEYVPNPKGPEGVANDKVAKPAREPGYEYQERSSGIFIAGGLGAGMVFDTLPAVHHNALNKKLAAGSDTGLTYYQYDLLTNTFLRKSLITSSLPAESRTPASDRAAFTEKLQQAKSVDDRAWTQVKIGHTWLEENQFEKARQEYRQALKPVQPQNAHLRAAITIEIAKSFMKEKNFTAAASTYEDALRIGPGGGHLEFAKKEFDRARKLAELQKKAEKETPKDE